MPSSLLCSAIPLVEARSQDVHISCPAELMETLVQELQQQLANTPTAEIYDWGYSSRFRQGFVVVSWDGGVPAEFEAQLRADPRLEGHSLYDLPAQSYEPLSIAAGKGA
jgi:hypothetical protein